MDVEFLSVQNIFMCRKSFVFSAQLPDPMSFHHVSVRILFAVSLAPLFLIIRIPSYAHAALPAANSATKNPQEAEEDQFQESLYLPDDPMLQLNISTFNSSIYGKPKGILVEFYSSWCGHCINFAPLWRTFAKDVEGKCSQLFFFSVFLLFFKRNISFFL